MNHDSVNEYILWLQKFREIYSKYLNSSEELQEIFASTLERLHRILSGNNTTSTEEDIIRLLKELVKNFSIVYDSNNSWNKSMQGPRNTNAFKQNIYMSEILELKEWLINNINDPKFENNFEKILMFVAKKRQMIEFLKLGKVIDDDSIDDCVYFEIFGKKRDVDDELKSNILDSKGEHLHDEFSNKGITGIQHTYLEGKILLTKCNFFAKKKKSSWQHTHTSEHPILFEIMNKLYSEFLSLANRRNNTTKRDKLVELYWLYIQTCPFERGSASIGEILFSVLLRKYFECDFLISSGWKGKPLTIPDIHALTYVLAHFMEIFWTQFTNCTGKLNSKINNATANRLKAEVIRL